MRQELLKKLSGGLGIVSVMAATGVLAAPQYVPFGVNFSPYEGNQNPIPGTLTLSHAEVSARLGTIKGNAVWVRSYSTTHGFETIGALAHSKGFKIAEGAWLGEENDAAGLAANQLEIANLIAAANRGEVDVALVGSETQQGNLLPAASLIKYMQQVRAAIPAGIPVTTDDTYNELLANPSIVAGCDSPVLANFYPYWEGVRIDGAISVLDSEYTQMQQAAGSKSVWIGESGWPSAGSAVGVAVPNALNAAYYFGFIREVGV